MRLPFLPPRTRMALSSPDLGDFVVVRSALLHRDSGGSGNIDEARTIALLPSIPPERIAHLSREGTWELLSPAPGIAIPRTLRLDRQSLARLGGDAVEFPIIARPNGSHAGQGLTKIDTPAGIAAYLQQQPEVEFYVAQGMIDEARAVLTEQLARMPNHPPARAPTGTTP